MNRAGHAQGGLPDCLLVLAGAEIDRIVEHVNRARERSRDGYSCR